MQRPELTTRFTALNDIVTDCRSGRFFLEVAEYEPTRNPLQLPRLRPDKDWASNVDLAHLLAALSYDYGDASIGASRLRYAADVALSHGDTDQVASSISQLYEAEKRRSSDPAQLRALRAEVRDATLPLRAGYRTRAGRLWAAGRADRLLGQLTRDELSDGANFVEVFKIEALKSRLLLDQLSLHSTPLRIAGDIKAAAAVERELLAFPSCPHSHDDMLERELLSNVAGNGLYAKGGRSAR